MLGGPVAGSLSHPSSDILLLQLVPAFLQYPPDELLMGTSKSVVLGGGLGLMPLLICQLLSTGACAEAEGWMNWLAQNLLLATNLRLVLDLVD